MNAIGVPVRSDRGGVIASLSLAAVKDCVEVDRVPELIGLASSGLRARS